MVSSCVENESEQESRGKDDDDDDERETWWDDGMLKNNFYAKWTFRTQPNSSSLLFSKNTKLTSFPYENMLLIYAFWMFFVVALKRMNAKSK